MTFIIHTNLPLAFLALTAGVALIIWALQNKGDGSAFAMFVGTITFIFMSLSVVCTLYMGYLGWNASVSVTPMDVHMKNQMKPMEMPKPEVPKPQ